MVNQETKGTRMSLWQRRGEITLIGCQLFLLNSIFSLHLTASTAYHVYIFLYLLYQMKYMYESCFNIIYCYFHYLSHFMDNNDRIPLLFWGSSSGDEIDKQGC